MAKRRRYVERPKPDQVVEITGPPAFLVGTIWTLIPLVEGLAVECESEAVVIPWSVIDRARAVVELDFG
jgi:hypothetical protein